MIIRIAENPQSQPTIGVQPSALIGRMSELSWRRMLEHCLVAASYSAIAAKLGNIASHQIHTQRQSPILILTE